MGDEARTVFCGNLSEKMTEELLYELFLQVAPLEKVRIPTDKDGRKSNFAFVTMKHEVSVNYAVQLLNGTSLFDKRINIKPRNTNQNHMMQRNEHQQIPNSEHQNLVSNFNELFLMEQMMQLTYNNCLQPTYNNPRHMLNNKPYKQPYNRHDNYHNPGRQQGRNNHQRNNSRSHNDRNRRQRYY